MEILDVYETQRTLDLNDGTGEVHVGYFKNEDDAERAGEQFKTLGGGQGHWIEKTQIIVFDSYDEYADNRDRKILEQMKQRLTDEELKALQSAGLNI